MVRTPRMISPTHIYHVMARGNERKNIFLDDWDRNKFLNVLYSKKQESKFNLYGYCLMANHVHLIIHEFQENISQIMQKINLSYAIYFNKKYNRVGHLFQDRFKSEVVDNERYLLALVRYIHNNPIKANIVTDLNSYKWSSYNEYISQENRLVDIDFALDIIVTGNNIDERKERFIDFSNEVDEKEFLDYRASGVKQINCEEKALEFIRSYLKNNEANLEYIKEKGKIKGTIKHELIVELKNRSSLGYREIGKLLGVSKSMVHKLK